MELYFRTDLSFDSLAQKLREVLNIPQQNRQPFQIGQHRDGLNFGGEYYLFEILGLELIVLRNEGEVAVPERADWPYYLYVEESDERTAECLTHHLHTVLSKVGFVVEVDTLT